MWAGLIQHAHACPGIFAESSSYQGLHRLIRAGSMDLSDMAQAQLHQIWGIRRIVTVYLRE